MHTNTEQQEECSTEHGFSPLLFSFTARFKFDKKNLNRVNNDGVTPLTIAIEVNLKHILLELLQLKTNPLVENIHGNTALTLSQDKPGYLAIIKQAIENKTCTTLDYKTNSHFSYDDKTFIITKVLQGGACSLAVFELQDCHTLEKHFAKVKTYFGGLEIRNYIFLNQYVDLFIIKKLNLYDHEQNIVTVIENVYCLMQKIVPGQILTIVLTSSQNPDEKKTITVAAIKSICNLHKQGYIHNDALPNNCFWEQETQTVTFIDYDVMRTLTDIISKGPEYLEEAEYNDLKRLIMGDISNGVSGLMHFIENIAIFLKDFDSTILKPTIKNKLLRCIMP